MPKWIQTDGGLNFMSQLFPQVVRELQINHQVSRIYYSSASHKVPLNGSIRHLITCCAHIVWKLDWNKGVPLLLFAVCDSVQESLGVCVWSYSVRINKGSEGTMVVISIRSPGEVNFDIFLCCLWACKGSKGHNSKSISSSQDDKMERFDCKAVNPVHFVLEIKFWLYWQFQVLLYRPDLLACM